MRTQKSMSFTHGAKRHGSSLCWTQPHAGKTPAWLDAAGSGPWCCKGAWPAWGVGLPQAVFVWLFAGRATVFQKPRLLSL